MAFQKTTGLRLWRKNFNALNKARAFFCPTLIAFYFKNVNNRNMDRTIIDNKKALHEYEILEKFDAGIVLYGYEAKAVKSGNMNLRGAFVAFHNGEAYLTGAHIGRYKPAGGLKEYDPERSRKLLLKKKELRYLSGKKEVSGLTIVPLRVYIKHSSSSRQGFGGGKIKVEIAVARGKRQFEKKEKIKARDIERDIRRTLKL